MCKMHIYFYILPHRKIGGNHPFNFLFLSICQWLASIGVCYFLSFVSTNSQTLRRTGPITECTFGSHSIGCNWIKV